jgi:hypothetical protein
MANEPEAIEAIGIGEFDYVGREGVQVVSAHVTRCVARVVPAHVGHDDVIAGLRERRDLLAPGPPEFRKAMQEDKQRVSRISRLHHMKPDAIDLAINFSPPSCSRLAFAYEITFAICLVPSFSSAFPGLHLLGHLQMRSDEGRRRGSRGPDVRLIAARSITLFGDER